MHLKVPEHAGAVHPLAAAQQAGDCILGFHFAGGKHIGFCFLVVYLEMLNMQVIICMS